MSIHVLVSYRPLISISEKRNERVTTEVDEKAKLLAKLKAEYKKLQSSAVCFHCFNRYELPTNFHVCSHQSAKRGRIVNFCTKI